MDFGSVEGLLITLLVLLPGGLGNALMRSITTLSDSKSDFARMLSAAGWSLGILTAIELVHTLIGDEPLGSFLILPLTKIGITNPPETTSLIAWRYLLFVALALILPTMLRWLLRKPWLESIRSGRTMNEPSLNRLMRCYVPRGERSVYARIKVGDNLEHEGWVLWSSDGTEEDSAFIIRDLKSYSVTWIPVSEIKLLTLVDRTTDGQTPSLAVSPGTPSEEGSAEGKG